MNGLTLHDELMGDSPVFRFSPGHVVQFRATNMDFLHNKISEHGRCLGMGLGEWELRGLGFQQFGVQAGGGWLAERLGLQGQSPRNPGKRDQGEATAGRRRSQVTCLELKWLSGWLV